ncbi:HCLS1-binding protein 3 [Hypomesus transpacificus]|uniref:HCLS1-binding protein 3 n=1 Tax=Hypomesus transpacificus TaxID=137520 RepID=UPI001F080F8F|nr:HCLS1-binding protein 3 [Hypomesus transpacificus]
MFGGLVTKRSLQNEVTGIDLQVPLYNEVRGTMMTGHVEYQIIVVTRLAAFKSPKHKQEDTIQLLVSKKYSEFNEFYNRLYAQYSSISLPAMPRKVLFVSEADIRERRLAFDALVKFISKNSTLAACPELLEFLGAKMNGSDFSNRNFAIEEDSENNEVSFFQKEETSTGIPREDRSEMKLINGDEQDSTEQGNVKHRSRKNVLPEGNSSDVKLLEEPELGASLLPPLGASLLPPAGASAGCGAEDDANELFRIEDDFDKLLQIKKCIKNELTSVPKTNPKPALLKKPETCISSGGQSLIVDQLKDQMDVLKYIQENESTAANDLELF